jgi:hypothetical protein
MSCGCGDRAVRLVQEDRLSVIYGVTAGRLLPMITVLAVRSALGVGMIVKLTFPRSSHHATADVAALPPARAPTIDA